MRLKPLTFTAEGLLPACCPALMHRAALTELCHNEILFSVFLKLHQSKLSSPGFGSNFCWLHSNMQTDFTEWLATSSRTKKGHSHLHIASCSHPWEAPPLLSGLQRSRAAWSSGAPCLEAPLSGHCSLNANRYRATQWIRQKENPEIVRAGAQKHT